MLAGTFESFAFNMHEMYNRYVASQFQDDTK